MNRAHTFRYCSLLLFAVVAVVFSPSVPAKKPIDVPPPSEDVEQRLNALEALVESLDLRLNSVESSVSALETDLDDIGGGLADLDFTMRRLHGNKGAYLELASSATDTFSFDGEAATIVLEIAVCPPNPPGGNCDSTTSDLFIATPPFDESDTDTYFTFDAQNVPNFGEIIDLLTNAQNDTVGIRFRVMDASDTFLAGRFNVASDRSRFVEYPQVSSDPGIVDLAGLEIGSIVFSIDNLAFFYNPNTGRTQVNYAFRILFGLAD